MDQPSRFDSLQNWPFQTAEGKRGGGAQEDVGGFDRSQSSCQAGHFVAPVSFGHSRIGKSNVARLAHYETGPSLPLYGEEEDVL